MNQNLWLERHNFECAKTQLGEVERVLEKETNKKRVTADHQIFREELAKRNKKKLEALQIMSRKRKKRLMLLFTGISMLLFFCNSVDFPDNVPKETKCDSSKAA